jgi:protease inhibitor Inh
MIFVRTAGATLIALFAAGCATHPFGDTTASTVDAGMTGRWMLSAPNAPACGMAFSGGTREGKVAPEGGCPGKFFMSRRWSLGDGGLTIVDDDNQPLATLSYANGAYEGKAATGLPVVLARPTAPPEQ